MADQEIKTTIDALVSFVNEHGETNVTIVASALGVGENTIVEWADILEKANMMRVTYKSGKMYLSPTPITGQTVEQFRQEQKLERSHLEADISSQLAAVDQISAKVADFNKSIGEVEWIFTTKYKGMKTILDRLKAVQDQMEDADKKIKAKSAQIAEINSKLKGEFEGMQKYSMSLEKFNLDTNNARNVATDINNRIATYKENIGSMSKEIEKAIAERRKSAAAIIATMKEETGKMEQILNYDQKQIAEYEIAELSFKRNAEASLKAMKKERTQVMDELSKSDQKVQRLGEFTEKQLIDLNIKLEQLKKEIGPAAEFNDKLNDIKKQFAEVQSQKESISKELNIMLQELRAIDKLDKGHAVKSMELDKISKKARKSSESLKKVGKLSDDLGSRFRDLGK